MDNKNKTKKFFVDNDAIFLKSLEMEFLQNTDFEVNTFSTGELCLKYLSPNLDVIVLDYHLDSIDKNAMNSLETLDKIKEFNQNIPVVMLSSHDTIDVTISCMHHNVIDYVVKSETVFIRLRKVIDSIIQYQKMEKQLNWYMERM